MYCRDDFVLSVHDAIEKNMMNDYAWYTVLCLAFQISGQERIQAEGDVRDATARQSHLRKRLQELSEARPQNG